MMSAIRMDIESGHSLSIACKKFKKIFNFIACQLIEAGEKSGTLDVMLIRIAEYQEKNFKIKRQIKQALFYPALILIFATLVTFIMLIFVIPRFEELFAAAHCTLPFFTQAVLVVSRFLKQNLILICMAVTFLSFTSCQLLKLPKLKLKRDMVLLHLPLLSSFIKKAILAYILRNLAILFAAGIPLNQALVMTAYTTRNLGYVHALQALEQEVLNGKQLFVAMLSNKLFPPMVIQMIQVGEESGTLEQMLAKAADFYDVDIDHGLEYFGQLLEPFIMVVLGILIGGLVIAMYLPIFKLGTTI